jgi:hypothetical protein
MYEVDGFALPFDRILYFMKRKEHVSHLGLITLTVVLRRLGENYACATIPATHVENWPCKTIEMTDL